MKQRTKKIKLYTSNLLDYLVEGEYNIFRVQQLAKFGVICTSGVLFFILMNQLMAEEQWRSYWKLICVYFVPPAGKETVIPLGLQLDIPQFLWCFSIWYFDLLVGFSVLANWWLIEIAIKYSKTLRRMYNKLQLKLQKLESKKYGKYICIILFIIMVVPLQGSGAISTALIGSWLGIRRSIILVIIALGSLFSILLVILVYYSVVKIW